MNNIDILIRLFFATLFVLSLITLLNSIINIQKSKLKTYPFIVISICFYILSIVVNISATNVTSLIFSQKIMYVVSTFFPSIWLLFSLEITNIGTKKTFIVIASYSVFISAVLAILYVTSFDSGSFFSSYDVSTFFSLKIFKYVKTDVYNFFILYATLCFISSGVFTLIKFINKENNLRNIFIIYSIISFILALSSMANILTYLVGFILIGPLALAFVIFFNRFFERFQHSGTSIFNAFENYICPVIIVNNNNKIVNFNKKASVAFPELRKKALPIMVSYIHTINIEDFIEGNVKKLRHVIPYTNEKRLYEIEVINFSQKNNYFKGKSIIFKDRMQLLDLQNKYTSIAKYDYLTGAYNKIYYNILCRKVFEKALNSDINVALCLFDIDKFQDINDTHGYDVGDKILNEIASIANRTVASYKDRAYVFRLSSDKFAVMISDVATDDALDCFETIRVTIENTPIISATSIIYYTISGGVEISQTSSAINYEDFTKNTKEKLYVSKKRGKNLITYSTNQFNEPIIDKTINDKIATDIDANIETVKG
ncbi:MAG: diguanylate cyclase [Lachnospirales bacterium]